MPFKTVCAACGASPCFAICPTQDPFQGDQAAEDADHDFNARYDDKHERYDGYEDHQDVSEVEPYNLARRVLRGLMIFDRHGASSISTEHDVIWAGHDLAPYATDEDTGETTVELLNFTAEELVELVELRWTWDGNMRSWHHNV
jgi:hypothetical protein